MQVIFASYNKKGENDKLFINNGNFSDNNKLFIDYIRFYNNDNFLSDYDNIRMANASDIEIPYIFSSNGLPDFSIISQCNKVTYIADIAYKAGFTLLANIFVAKLCNFLSLKINGLHIVQLIIYKLKFKKTQSLF